MNLLATPTKLGLLGALGKGYRKQELVRKV